MVEFQLFLYPFNTSLQWEHIYIIIRKQSVLQTLSNTRKEIHRHLEHTFCLAMTMGWRFFFSRSQFRIQCNVIFIIHIMCLFVFLYIFNRENLLLFVLQPRENTIKSLRCVVVLGRASTKIMIYQPTKTKPTAKTENQYIIIIIMFARVSLFNATSTSTSILFLF